MKMVDGEAHAAISQKLRQIVVLTDIHNSEDWEEVFNTF